MWPNRRTRWDEEKTLWRCSASLSSAAQAGILIPKKTCITFIWFFFLHHEWDLSNHEEHILDVNHIWVTLPLLTGSISVRCKRNSDSSLSFTALNDSFFSMLAWLQGCQCGSAVTLYLTSYWMDCQGFWYIHSWYPGDKSYWLWWISDLSFGATNLSSGISRPLSVWLARLLMQIFMMPVKSFQMTLVIIWHDKMKLTIKWNVLTSLKWGLEIQTTASSINIRSFF